MEDYMNNDSSGSGKSIRGYQIIVIVLAVILAVLAFFYFRQTKQLKNDAETEKAILSGEISDLRMNLDSLQTNNLTINQNLEAEKVRVDSLYDALQKERNASRSTIRRYENELKTLKSVMNRYVAQIDSLNTLNRALARENVEYRREASNERLRAEVAEEKNSELTEKVKAGSVIRARNIGIVALNNNDKSVARASRAVRLQVNFVLAANDIAQSGTRPVYARITGPDGYILAGDASSQFEYQGERITYSAARDVDYRNADLDVSLYYNGDVVSGTYSVEIYMDGNRIGQAEALFK